MNFEDALREVGKLEAVRRPSWPVNVVLMESIANGLRLYNTDKSCFGHSSEFVSLEQDLDATDWEVFPNPFAWLL